MKLKNAKVQVVEGISIRGRLSDQSFDTILLSDAGIIVVVPPHMSKSAKREMLNGNKDVPGPKTTFIPFSAIECITVDGDVSKEIYKETSKCFETKKPDKVPADEKYAEFLKKVKEAADDREKAAAEAKDEEEAADDDGTQPASNPNAPAPGGKAHTAGGGK